MSTVQLIAVGLLMATTFGLGWLIGGMRAYAQGFEDARKAEERRADEFRRRGVETLRRVRGEREP